MELSTRNKQELIIDKTVRRNDFLFPNSSVLVLICYYKYYFFSFSWLGFQGNLVKQTQRQLMHLRYAYRPLKSTLTSSFFHNPLTSSIKFTLLWIEIRFKYYMVFLKNQLKFNGMFEKKKKSKHIYLIELGFMDSGWAKLPMEGHYYSPKLWQEKYNLFCLQRRKD